MNEETELMNYRDFRELAKRKEGIINSIKDSCESEDAAWLVLYERPKRIIIEIRLKDLESTKKE
jgi:hypothetical protein